MRILLDENVPRALRRELAGHDVESVVRMGWASIRNGELLRRASLDFDVLVTCDQRMQFQQDLQSFDIALVVLMVRKNDMINIRPLIPSILSAIHRRPGSGTVTTVGGSTAL